MIKKNPKWIFQSKRKSIINTFDEKNNNNNIDDDKNNDNNNVINNDINKNDSNICTYVNEC